ncbi:MAG TPA: hypothetical protein VGO92_06415, partial [Acidimicrobiales bacterium]|nr:hypothetical protein [Acidimicrobiales bacterium]
MTSASEVVTTTGGTRPDWARKYPPLLAIFVALAIVLAVLPSALNLPQSNPTQTLEYAPVPPDDQSNDAVQGNLGALGMGSSSGINGGGAAGGQGAGGGPLDIPPPPAVVEPGQQCVGKPPRQTVDPLSPPCVVGFDGDNFGATYQGVTDKEIRLLIYLDGGINYISSSDPSKRISPQDKYYDLFKTYATDDSEHPQHFLVDGLRVWQKYFNERFQRYKRNVHFFVYFSDRGNGATSDLRRQNAADNFAKVNPFAVISFATEGFEDAYLQAMARKGVLNFGSFGLRPASFFQQFPKLIWSYLPSVEQQTDSFVNYVCRKVAYPGATATMAGADLKDKPRTFGILHTTDEKQQGLILAANIVKDRLKKECNVDFAGEATYPACCLAQDNGEVPDYAGRSMAEFR